MDEFVEARDGGDLPQSSWMYDVSVRNWVAVYPKHDAQTHPVRLKPKRVLSAILR